SVFVPPGMGDEGLPVGAALAASADLGRFRLERLEHVFWGPEYGAERVEKALAASGLAHRRVADVEARIAERLAARCIVARCSGRVGYGPRPLAHRRLLHHPRR